MDITPNSKVSLAVLAMLAAALWTVYAEAAQFKERLTQLEREKAIESYKSELMSEDINGFKKDIKTLRQGQNAIARKQDLIVALLERERDAKTKVR